jgi:hypothetical protein
MLAIHCFARLDECSIASVRSIIQDRKYRRKRNCEIRSSSAFEKDEGGQRDHLFHSDEHEDQQ